MIRPTFTVDAFPDQSFSGQVAQVRLAATTVQNVVTYSVMVHARNPGEILLPGMTANVGIVTDHRENVLRVPNDATRFKPAGASDAVAGNAVSANGQAGGGGQGGARLLDNEQMLKDLGITAEQKEKLQKALQAMFKENPGPSRATMVPRGWAARATSPTSGNRTPRASRCATVSRTRWRAC